ncbi:MAG: dTDP-4-dehydrorhamnose 3,5-epimerase [Salinivirgaceae bacterium]|nr:dTDP-4-dehydrorhamnose 3,5-epimerase [Salinivirgaceae bacterium]MDD4746402.1 dTDP-4-dehydrorhamnose 3,5-epimerase [Salinivirgaceae bacterium]MDY0279716.1 dTDP-4-dehydrorhamnose 3,5-epimerase [Salinivirgaceae bacterium]
MKIIETGFPDLVVVEPKVFKDDRGYFFESYSHKTFSENGIDTVFCQDNQAKSSVGVIRGLHYQLPPFAQTKLLRVVEGAILDVVVDLRKGSPTFGRYFSVELTAENFLQLFVPKGFAHGYSVLSDICIVQYKCDSYYAPHAEAGVNLFDPKLDIDWKIPHEKAIISPKDRIWPMLDVAVHDFEYEG